MNIEVLSAKFFAVESSSVVAALRVGSEFRNWRLLRGVSRIRCRRDPAFSWASRAAIRRAAGRRLSFTEGADV